MKLCKICFFASHWYRDISPQALKIDLLEILKLYEGITKAILRHH